MNFFLRTYTWNSTRKYHSHTIVQRSKKEKENHKHESSKYTRINETAGAMKLYYLQIYHMLNTGHFIVHITKRHSLHHSRATVQSGKKKTTFSQEPK